jgi:hypothetical protein
MSKHLLLRYLDVRRLPLDRIPDGLALHDGLLAAVPRFYRHVAVDPVADVSHRREALARLLDDTGADNLVADLIERLLALPAVEVLRTLEVLVQQQINRHRACKLALSVVLNHPQLAELAATRRQRLTRLLKHLVGERTWSAVGRALAKPANGDEVLLQRTLWNHVAPERIEAAREALRFLAGAAVEPGEAILRKRLAARTTLKAGEGLPRETLFGIRGTFHPATPASEVRYLAPARPNQGQDGPLTARYKTAWGEDGTGTAELVPVPAAPAPLAGRVAVVLDLSASMASSGERAFHPAALGLALYQRLQAQFRDLTMQQVGGSVPAAEGGLPQPQGGTDLAGALLEAARANPEVILIVTEGYENSRTGDAADVAEGLRRLDPALQIFQVVPRFTPAEDLSSRRLAETIALLPVDHENDVGELLARVVLTHAGAVVSDEEMDQLETLLSVSA